MNGICVLVVGIIVPVYRKRALIYKMYVLIIKMNVPTSKNCVPVWVRGFWVWKIEFVCQYRFVPRLYVNCQIIHREHNLKHIFEESELPFNLLFEKKQTNISHYFLYYKKRMKVRKSKKVDWNEVKGVLTV